MKKNYFFLLLMLMFCCISTAQAGVVVESIDDPLTDVSGIVEGDYLAFQETKSDMFLYNYQYNTSPTTYEWRLQFDKGNLPGEIGKTNSQQYVWKVVGLSKDGNTISCKLQGHTGSYIPVLDNSDYGFNYSAEEGDTFTFTKSSENDTWIIKGAEGPKFTAEVSGRWYALTGSNNGSEFRVYKPTIKAAQSTVSVKFECYTEDGDAVNTYFKTHEVSVGETVTVPTIIWEYTFLSCVNEEDGSSYKEGEKITVNGPATYIITVRPWPTITFAYYDEDGNPLYEEGATEPATYTTKYEPGTTFSNIGGVYGYYVPEDVFNEYAAMTITDDMDGKTFNITLKKSPYVTVSYVDENGDEIANTYEGYITPGDAIPVETFSWYTLTEEDQKYIYNEETGEGYTVGTEEKINIVLHYTRDALPFEATTLVNDALADNTKWYTIRFNGNKFMNADLNLVTVNKGTDITEGLQWAFVGDLEEGYLLYNKTTGIKTLSVEKVEEGATPAMSESGTPFLLKKGSNGQLTLSIITYNEYWVPIDACLNDYDGKNEVRLFTGNMNGGTYNEGSHLTFIEFNDLINGIENVTTNVENSVNSIYDLQGRRVLNPTKGLYIVGGKKMFLK